MSPTSSLSSGIYINVDQTMALELISSDDLYLVWTIALDDSAQED